MYGASDRDQFLNDLNDLVDWLKSRASEVEDNPAQKRFNVADRLEEMSVEVREYEREVRDGRTE